MALSFSNLATQKLFSSKFVFVILVTFFLLVAAENANSQKKVYFNITKFTYDQSDLTFLGSILIDTSGVLSLPNPFPSGSLVGRVLYKYLVPIWDSSTGNVGSFETSFSYEVWNYGHAPGDGLVLFLTDPANAAIPDNSRDGLLGVADANNAFNRFVGVEFDNYANPWDPNYEHIGINLNSLYSAKIMKWRWVYGYGTLLKVNIIYDSPSSTLTVVVTDDDGEISTLSQMLDLKWLLPEMAVIGISGSSGFLQINDILSWSFTSVLDTTTRSNSNNINNITTASY
ncbi:putative bark agglutinin LECRPA3 [Trifolium pratense]|uniref:putative bark agglutinin LECRPA3 n=1 Tax=Trifolium pratense TaxID=57577 RepID=UPI001E693B2C|nr:putative bark agglutinin LECRPA3 [Trifolium pratense]